MIQLTLHICTTHVYEKLRLCTTSPREPTSAGTLPLMQVPCPTDATQLRNRQTLIDASTPLPYFRPFKLCVYSGPRRVLAPGLGREFLVYPFTAAVSHIEFFVA